MEKGTKKPLFGIVILLIATIIWGLAYIAQSKAMQYVGVLTFNSVRILLGGVVLIPAAVLSLRIGGTRQNRTVEQRRHTFRISLIGGMVCGLCLGAAATFQQYGISMTSAGKSGFLTALYIVLVPILGIAFHRRATWLKIVAVVIAIVGSYYLCVKDGFTIERGDWMLILDAVMFAFQILFIDFFLERGGDSVTMTCVEFLFAGLLSCPLMFLFETPEWSGIWAARYTILYAGVVSGAVGYTMQMLGQKELEPTGASLLMSLESVFAALFGWWLLGERMSGRELFGCALVFAAVIISQLPTRAKQS